MTDTFVINNRWALGDTVCLSALVRDVQIAYPGKYKLLMAGHHKSLWQHNPHCQIVGDAYPPGSVVVTPEYTEGIKAAGRGEKVHFLSWFHRDFAQKTKIVVPVTAAKGDIHLSPAEKAKRIYPYRYWLVVAGGKQDMTAKVWSTSRFQAVVDSLAALGIRCVQAGADFKHNFHPRLKHCECAIGKTDSNRDLFSLVHHCEGVICGVTAMMHLAAAFEKPCVALAGGREEPWWEGYLEGPDGWPRGCVPPKVPHRFLHTVGLLDCGVGNLTKGCWRLLTTPLTYKDRTDPRRRQILCTLPMNERGQDVPTCLLMIDPALVVESVLSYYLTGILQPPETNAMPWPPISNEGTRVILPDGRPAGIKVTLGEPPAAPPAKSTFSPGPPLTDVKGRIVGPPPARTPTARPAALPGPHPMDHPDIGGKVTVFVLGYGEHKPLMERCLGSLLTTTPAERIDLRVALNQPSQANRSYVNSLTGLTKLYIDTETRRKYDAMRQMFYDAACPITTKYLIWVDDDTWFPENNWLDRLAESIAANHGQGCRMYGVRFIHDVAPFKRQGKQPENWLRAATWWKNKPLFDPSGNRQIPNGTAWPFVGGSFWALDVAAMRAADIPDTRLVHNGGDCCLGLQLHQAGFRIKDFTRGKTPVRWSDAPRRGFSEPFPWSC